MEVEGDSGCTAAVDLWSLGIILLEMFSGIKLKDTVRSQEWKVGLQIISQYFRVFMLQHYSRQCDKMLKNILGLELTIAVEHLSQYFWLLIEVVIQVYCISPFCCYSLLALFHFRCC